MAEIVKPSRMTWNGTPDRVRELLDWGKDEALIAYIAAETPNRNDPDDAPRIKVLTNVSAADGGGVTWTEVPVGAVIRNTNTGTTAWSDPVFEIVTAPAGRAAAVFEE